MIKYRLYKIKFRLKYIAVVCLSYKNKELLNAAVMSDRIIGDKSFVCRHDDEISRFGPMQ